MKGHDMPTDDLIVLIIVITILILVFGNIGGGSTKLPGDPKIPPPPDEE